MYAAEGWPFTLSIELVAECKGLGLLDSRGDLSIDNGRDFSSLALVIARRGDEIRMGDEMAIGDSIERHLKESVECLLTKGVVLPRSDFVKQTPVCVDPNSPAANGSCETLYVKHKMKETILFEVARSVTCNDKENIESTHNASMLTTRAAL